MLKVLRRILAPDVMRNSLYKLLLNWHDSCNNYPQDSIQVVLSPDIYNEN